MHWRRSKRRTGYENRIRNRPISGGRDLPYYGAEWLPALHSLSPAAGHRWTVHGCPLCLALPVGDLRVSGHRRCTSAGQPLRTVGGGTAGTSDCQHPYFPRFDGTERASAGPLRGCTVGGDLHRRETGIFRVVPVTLADAGLTAGERNKNMAQELTVVVTGSTGKQGGAVARGLLERGHKVRAVTRDPNSSQAKLLANAGATLVAASLADTAAVMKALEGATSLFAMTTPFGGTALETRQGVVAADAAKTAGVHLVFTSVGNADRQTGIPHFDSKYEVEKHIAKIGVRATILAPVAFMENLYFIKEQLAKGIYAAALPPTRALAQVAVADIGAVAVRVLEDAGRFTGKRFDLAGDELTGNDALATLSRVTGRPFAYYQLPLDVIRQRMGEDAVKMYEWFDRVGFAVDRTALRHEFPDIAFHDFESWAKGQDWNALRQSA